MSEHDWIHRYIRPLIRAEGADFLRDDVAVLTPGLNKIITMDTLVEGRHFLSDDPLETVGQKLIRVNVSDIVAKGAEPDEALLSIAWPLDRDELAFQHLTSGLKDDLKAFKVQLIGGDFVRTDGPLTLTLTMTGRCLGEGPVRRGMNAQAGSKLWVSGPIGEGAIGLEAARTGGPRTRIEAYRVPRIRADYASYVARVALAAMDVSDGLLQDAITLAQINGCGAEINLSKVPLADPVHELDRILQQVTGGDDYKILMATAPDQAFGIYEFTEIGRLTPDPGLKLVHMGRLVPLPARLGYVH